MPNLTAFLSYVVVTSFTPGPNNIMSMSNASRYGFIKSLPFNAGVAAGFFILVALSSYFSLTLYSLIPSIKPFMTYIGAIYILWLAWKTFKSTPQNEGENEKPTNTFLTGVALQFVNPKAILYGITTVSTFIVPYYKSALLLAGFSIFLAAVGFVSTSSWSLFGSIFQRVLTNNAKVINAVMALLLVYCAISLFH